MRRSLDRDLFVALGLFDHSVFDEPDLGRALSAERERLWSVYDGHTSNNLEPGVYVDVLITTSGHPVQLVQTAGRYARTIAEMDPELDDPAFLRNMYSGCGMEMTKAPKVEWCVYYQDLGILDATTNTFFLIDRGTN